MQIMRVTLSINCLIWIEWRIFITEIQNTILLHTCNFVRIF
jgi:hypothetical protein